MANINCRLKRINGKVEFVNSQGDISSTFALLRDENQNDIETALRSYYGIFEQQLSQMVKDNKSYGKFNFVKYEIANPNLFNKVPRAENKRIINVYYGQDESDTSTKKLSNLAERRFKWQGRMYGSVEHAYQTLKSGKFDGKVYDEYNNLKTRGYGRKIQGAAKANHSTNLQLMKDLVVESFKQNPNSEASEMLMRYDDYTHNTNETIDKAFLEGLRLARNYFLNNQIIPSVFVPSNIKAEGDTDIYTERTSVDKSKNQSENNIHNEKLKAYDERIAKQENLIIESAQELSKFTENKLMLNGVEIDLLDSGITFKPNNDQLKALEEIANFLENKNGVLAHTLTGSAGTGKSSITAIVADYLSKTNKNVQFASISHAAKNILQNMIGANYKVETIAKMMGSNADIVNDILTFKISDDAKDLLRSLDVIVIDEISMVNDVTTDIILEIAKSLNIKVLFIGDKEQLNPVKQDEISKVFLDRNIKVSELKKIERQQNGNPLGNYLADILNSTNKDSRGIKLSTNINDATKEGIVVTNKKGFIDAMKNAFTTNNYKEDYTFARVLAYRNATVNEYNNVIRNALGYTEPYTVGENILLYGTVKSKDKDGVDLTNGGNYKIISKTDAINRINSINLKGELLMLQDLDQPDEKPTQVFAVIAEKNKPETLKALFDYKADILNRAEYAKKIGDIAGRKKIFKYEYYPLVQGMMYNFNINQNGSFEYSSDELESKSFSKNADYGYAMTVHKSQGSTFKNIFVDEEDINSVKKDFEHKKLLYVAQSRASSTSVTNRTGAPTSSTIINYERQDLNKDKKKELRNQISNIKAKSRFAPDTILSFYYGKLQYKFMVDNFIGKPVSGYSSNLKKYITGTIASIELNQFGEQNYAALLRNSTFILNNGDRLQFSNDSDESNQYLLSTLKEYSEGLDLIKNNLNKLKALNESVQKDNFSKNLNSIKELLNSKFGHLITGDNSILNAAANGFLQIPNIDLLSDKQFKEYIISEGKEAIQNAIDCPEL